MTDILLPVALDIARVKFRVLDSVGVSRNPLNGAVRTAARGGDKLAATIEYAPTGGMSTSAKQRQRILRAHIAQLVRSNRVCLYDPGYVPQGSFPATELLTNNDFSNGTTGWSTQAATISVTDGVLRITATGNSGPPAIYQSVTLTQYAPYVLRGAVVARSSLVTSNGPYLNDSGGIGPGGNYSSALSGVKSQVMVAETAGASASIYPAVMAAGTFVAGDCLDVFMTSLSRPIPADAGQNYLQYSDQIDNAAWTKTGTTVTANYYTAPDGTVTADRVIEDTSTGEHYVLQAATRAAAADTWCFAGAFCKGDVSSLRDRIYVRVLDGAGTSFASAIFDLTNGVISTAASAAGSATNARGFIKSMGGGWYYCCLLVRLPASDTSVRAAVNLVSNPSTTSYTGGSSRNIGMWRATLSKSQLPVRLVQTTSTATTTGTSQTGNSIYVKGLPVSTQGLLLFGDWVEVATSLGSQLCMVVSSLDSDAAGLGVLTVSPAVRGTVSDNAAIIVNTPMGLFLPAQGGEWQNDPGIFTTATAMDFEEAPA